MNSTTGVFRHDWKTQYLTFSEGSPVARIEWVFNADWALKSDEVVIIALTSEGEIVLAVATIELVFEVGGRHGNGGKLLEDALGSILRQRMHVRPRFYRLHLRLIMCSGLIRRAPRSG